MLKCIDYMIKEANMLFDEKKINECRELKDISDKLMEFEKRMDK